MGISAKNQATTTVKNTVNCFKRLLGRPFSDPHVQTEMKMYQKPFTVKAGPNGETLVQVCVLIDAL